MNPAADCPPAAKPLPAHGTLNRHKKHACRCTECVQASRDYDNYRDREIAYGRWVPPVDAQPVRDHIAMLAEHGIGWMRVAELAGLSSGILSRWLYGSVNCPLPKKINAANAAKVLAIRPTIDNVSDRACIDATGTARRLQALVAIGYPQAVLSPHLGIERSNLTKLFAARLVHASTARRVRVVFENLWDTLPEANGVNVHSARRARNHAAKRGWAPPAAWDDDIDSPDAQPAQWRPRPQRAEDLVEDAEFIQSTTGADWDVVADRLGVPVNTLHTYRWRVQKRAEAASGACAITGRSLTEARP